MVDTKICFKCGQDLPLSDFYRHKMMADGYLGKCKSCTKKDVLEHRWKNIERIRQYDRDRSTLPHRKASSTRRTKQWRREHPLGQVAHNAAIRRYRRSPEHCEMCGEARRLERHHPDYSLPLMIVWLCKPCHYKADTKRRKKEEQAEP